MAQFSQEQIDIFKTRFKEGFDLDDPEVAVNSPSRHVLKYHLDMFC